MAKTVKAAKSATKSATKSKREKAPAAAKPEAVNGADTYGLTVQFINFDVAQRLHGFMIQEVGENPFAFMIALASLCAVLHNGVANAPNSDEKGREFMHQDILKFLHHLHVHGYVMPDGSAPSSFRERMN